METAASQDLDGLTVTPLVLRYLKGHQQTAHTRAMVRQLRGWVAAGAHRRKAKASDTQYRHAAAIAIDDELMPNLIRAFYDRILAKGGETGVSSTGGATLPGYTKLPMQWVNTPNSGDTHLGSAYDGGFEGYLMSTLQQLLGRHPVDGFGRELTGRECAGGPASCRRTVARALARTYAALVTANGSRRVSSWTASSASQGRRPDDAGVRLHRVPRPRAGRPAEHRLAEPADLPAGGGVPPAPEALRVPVSPRGRRAGPTRSRTARPRSRTRDGCR